MRVMFLSEENVKNPIIKDILELGKKINRSGDISARYANRIVISTNQSLKNLNENDFVEVVDYNPSTDVALVIGKLNPLFLYQSIGSYIVYLRSTRYCTYMRI